MNRANSEQGLVKRLDDAAVDYAEHHHLDPSHTTYWVAARHIESLEERLAIVRRECHAQKPSLDTIHRASHDTALCVVRLDA